MSPKAALNIGSGVSTLHSQLSTNPPAHVNMPRHTCPSPTRLGLYPPSPRRPVISSMVVLTVSPGTTGRSSDIIYRGEVGELTLCLGLGEEQMQPTCAMLDQQRRGRPSCPSKPARLFVRRDVLDSVHRVPSSSTSSMRSTSRSNYRCGMVARICSMSIIVWGSPDTQATPASTHTYPPGYSSKSPRAHRIFEPLVHQVH